MPLFHFLPSLYRLIKPFECYHSTIFHNNPNIHEKKSPLIDSIYYVSTKIFNHFSEHYSLSKPHKNFIDKKKIILKNTVSKTYQSIKKVTLFVYNLYIFSLKIDPFAEEIDTLTMDPLSEERDLTKIVEIKRYIISISPIGDDDNKYFEIKKKHENYLENTPFPNLSAKKIFFNDTLKQILLTISSRELESIVDLDPTSKKPIIEIDLSQMEIEYTIFGIPIEIKEI